MNVKTKTLIEIHAQHLCGNDPDGFELDFWIQELTQEYRRIVSEHYPDADVVVKIDVQNASGSCAQVQVFGGNTDLEYQIEQAASRLHDARGEEFYS